MRFVIHARRFRGKGKIVCRRCNRKVFLEDNASVMLWDDGSQIRIVNPVDHSIVHRCGRVLEWVCDACHQSIEPYVSQSSTDLATDLGCPLCWDGSLRQREVGVLNPK